MSSNSGGIKQTYNTSSSSSSNSSNNSKFIPQPPQQQAHHNQFTRIIRNNNSAESLVSGNGNNNTLINLSSPPRNPKLSHASLHTSNEHSQLFNEVLTPIPVVRTINTSNSSLFGSADLDFDFLVDNNPHNQHSQYSRSSFHSQPPATASIFSNNFNRYNIDLSNTINNSSNSSFSTPNNSHQAFNNCHPNSFVTTNNNNTQAPTQFQLNQSTDALTPPPATLQHQQQQQQQLSTSPNSQSPPVPVLLLPKSPNSRTPRPASAPIPSAPSIFNNNNHNNSTGNINSSTGNSSSSTETSSSGSGHYHLKESSSSSTSNSSAVASPSSSTKSTANIEDNRSPPSISPSFGNRPHSHSLSGGQSSNTLAISPSKTKSPSTISPPASPSVSSPSSGSPTNIPPSTSNHIFSNLIGGSRPPNKPPPPTPNNNTNSNSKDNKEKDSNNNNNNINSNITTTVSTTIPPAPPPPKKPEQPAVDSSSWIGMSFKFFKKKLTPGVIDPKDARWDLKKTNSQVLKVEEKTRVSYIANHNGQKGIARASIPFSSTFSYFELFITGKEGKICFGLSSGEHPPDSFPGFEHGSYGFYGDGKIYLGNSTPQTYGPSFSGGDVVGCGVDANKSLYFTKNGVYLGTASKKVNSSGLFPTVGLQNIGDSVLIIFSPPFQFKMTEKQTAPTQVEDLIPKEELESCRWDANRCGRVITVRDRTASIALDSPSGTGVVQSTHPLQDGFCYFEVLIKNLDKGHVSIGLASKEYPLNLHIGWVKRSYGYHSDDGRKFKWKDIGAGINEGEPYGPGFKKGDIVGCGLFFETREIFFTKNGTYLGVAFNNVYGILYPSVAVSDPGSSIVATFSPPFRFSQVVLMMRDVSHGTQQQQQQQQTQQTQQTPQITTTINTTAQIGNNTTVGGSITNSVSFSSPIGSGSGGLSNTGSLTVDPNNNNTPQSSIFPSKSMPSLTALEQQNLQQPTRTSPPHSISLPGAPMPTNSLLASYSSSGSLDSSSSIPPPPNTYTHTNSNPNIQNPIKTSNSRQCVSLPASNTSTTLASSLASLSFSSLSPPSSPKTSPRKILSSSDELSFVQSFDGDGQQPSEWRRCGKSLKMKDKITVTMIKKKTSLAQANRPFPSNSSTICYFEVYIEGFDKKTYISVGLTHANHPFNKHIGREAKSYSYSSDGEKFGGQLGDIGESYGPPFVASPSESTVIGCGINNTTKEIFFTRNGVYLGVAFCRVTTDPLYPSISLRHAVGSIAVATFQAPFKFSFDSLPGISPSFWTESLGPDRGNQGFKGWPPNDVAIWLETIGYGQYRKNFRDNNISGRHLPLFTNQNLKNELGIEPMGHRADILNRVQRMVEIWKDRGGSVDSFKSGSMDSFKNTDGSSIHDSLDSNGSNDDDRLKKSVRWPDVGDSGEFENIGSQQKNRPTKIYTQKMIEDRNRRSTISGGEPKQKSKNSSTGSFDGSGDDFIIPEEERGQGSKTMTTEQLRFFMHKKDEYFDHVNNNFNLQNNNSPIHTFSPRPPPGQYNMKSSSGSINNNNNNNSSTHPPQPKHSPQSYLPPIIGSHQTYQQNTIHPSFVTPNIHFEQQQQEMSSSPKLQSLMNYKSHSGGMPQITSSSTASTNNSWDNSPFMNWEKSSMPMPPTQQSTQIVSQTPQPERREYEIDFNELEFGELLGKGFFGEVKRGNWRETDVAIKIIYRDQFKTKSSFEMFQNEVSILSKLRHPNVVQFLGACTTGTDVEHCIVIEWMGGGSLRQFLQDHFQILEQNPRLRLNIARDIAKGMCYLHGWTPPILHRDLSSRNILLDNPIDSRGGSHNVNDFKCKISDFGLSRLKMEQGTMTASVGCIPYMAPEVFQGESNSEKSDVYSYAMILWELLTSEEPQQDMKPQKMAYLAAHESYRPPIPLTTAPKWKELITMCWDSDPNRRPTFRQIIAHLKEMDLKGISSFAPIPVANFDTGFYG